MEPSKDSVLSREDELRLIACAQDGDRRAVHTLIRKFEKKLRAFTRNRVSGDMQKFDDAYQDCLIGFVKGINKFEASKGFRLYTYAQNWMKESIQKGEALRANKISVPYNTSAASIRSKVYKLARKYQELDGDEKNMAYDKAIVEIARLSSIPKATVLRAMNMAINSRVVSANTPLPGADEGLTVQDTLVDQSPVPESQLLSSGVDEYRTKLIREMMAALPPRDAEVIYRRFMLENPETLDDISKDMGVSRERIRQIEEKALETMRNIIRRKASSCGGMRAIRSNADMGEKSDDPKPLKTPRRSLKAKPVEPEAEEVEEFCEEETSFEIS